MVVALVALPVAQAKEETPDLGTARTFAVLGGTTVTNTGDTLVSGNLGVSPGTAVTGFPPGVVINGRIHAGNEVAAQAQNDLTHAYIDAMAQWTDYWVDGDIGGQTLTPGVYTANSSLAITGTLTLDGGGDPNAVFIFQIGSTLTTASESVVQLTGNVTACNVFWQVGSSATLGTYSSFNGTIMALESITATTNATVEGRLLARNGAVTLDSNTVTVPDCRCACECATGPAGPQGETGPAGPQGETGATGPQGETGPAGPAGSDGIDGTNGTDGVDGATGPMGPAGPQGETGATGPQGETGPAGPAGSDGIDGTNGTDGVDGATGPMGPEGPAGADGANGADGATGPMGPAGPAGADGADGATGPMGPEGPAGADGADGADGATGPMGPAGPAGVDGADGATGPMGPEGPAGADGADGADGATGPMGPAGPAGADGADGATGPMGPAGPQGEAGPVGPQGATGPAGPAGPQGETGDTGPQGETGPAGPQGDPGATGPAGPQGPQAPPVTEGPIALAAKALPDSTIELTWSPIDGADTIHIYRAVGDDDLSLHDEVDGNATSFIDTDTEVGVTYRYQIVSVANGVEIQASGVVEVTAIPFFPGVAIGAFALVGGVAAYALMRRRPLR